MATYTELYNLKNNSDLKNKITIACLVTADIIRAESTGTTNHAERVIWAKNLVSNLDFEAEKVFLVVLATNNALTVAQILAASDAQIQTAVNNAVNLLI